MLPDNLQWIVREFEPEGDEDGDDAPPPDGVVPGGTGEPG